MRLALDTNILAYAEGVNDADRQTAAIELASQVQPDNVIVPVQALAELYMVLVRKTQWSRNDARNAVLRWRDAFTPVDTSLQVLMGATDLATNHEFQIWDAVMLSAAAAAECRLLLSEDLHEGFTWSGVTITNPFATERSPILKAALASQ